MKTAIDGSLGCSELYIELVEGNRVVQPGEGEMEEGRGPGRFVGGKVDRKGTHLGEPEESIDP